jgi:Voltage gated chloride channel
MMRMSWRGRAGSAIGGPIVVFRSGALPRKRRASSSQRPPALAAARRAASPRYRSTWERRWAPVLRPPWEVCCPHSGLSAPSDAIVGMAAPVSASTGGVITAIVTVFEMTRDYSIIIPVIVAVALAASVRRALVAETIYTIKLRHRGHHIPKERHTNLYLVRQARDIMERHFIVAEASTTLKGAILPENINYLSAIVVVREGRIVGLFRRGPDFGWNRATIPRSPSRVMWKPGLSFAATMIC